MKSAKFTLKSEWFYPTLNGIKKEEYRDIKPYWLKRLFFIPNEYPFDTEPNILEHYCEQIIETGLCPLKPRIRNGQFTHGYDNNKFYLGGSPCERYPNFTIESKGIRIGKGKEEWGAEPGVNYFILEHGDIISTANCE
jgi:hypothetical protein